MSENGNSGTHPAVDADEVPVVEGRRAPFTMVADWVALAEASPQAKLLYVLYAMHVNQGRGDGSVWPRRRWLAEMMGFKKVCSLDRYNHELVALGAIDLEPRWIAPGVRGANLVRVHMTPPDGYDGPASLREYYEQRKTGGVAPGKGVPPPLCGGRGYPPGRGGKEPDEQRTTRRSNKRRSKSRPPACRSTTGWRSRQRRPGGRERRRSTQNTQIRLNRPRTTHARRSHRRAPHHRNRRRPHPRLDSEGRGNSPQVVAERCNRHRSGLAGQAW